ncbi:MAG: YceI family protein [Acidimicrobiia bacterium]
MMLAHVQDQVAHSAPYVLLGVAVAAAAFFAIVWRRRTPTSDGELDAEPAGRLWPRRAGLMFSGVLFFLALGAFLTSEHWTWLLEDGSVRSDGVTAPPVVLEPGDDLFRVGDESSATYITTERKAGNDSTVEGSTSLVAGEIALNRDDVRKSRIGTIVVNVEALESDSALRDKRIRHDFLESTEHPYVEFDPGAIAGLPAAAEEGVDYDVSVGGDLTVKETTEPVTFTGTVRLDAERVTATMEAEILMSSFDIGPIAVPGLLSTSDEVTLRFDLVADETEPGNGNATVAAASVGEVGNPGEYPFSETVQPILEESCASCHEKDGVGNETFPLETAGDAAEVADDLALVTGWGYMPPWGASEKSLPFDHDWSLSDDEKAEIAAWAEEGGGLDVPTHTPIEPSVDAIREVDADVTITPEPYAGTSEQLDDYRCRIYALPETDELRWVRSFTIVPDEKEIVHHAVFFHAEADVLETAREIDDADPGTGWACGGLTGLDGRVEQIAAWAPGQQPVEYPDGTGIRLEPGDFFVVQTHYHYDHEFPEDTSEVVVDFAPERDVAEGAVRPVDNATYLAPAEIPCSDEERGPLCDRDAVLRQLGEKFGPGAPLIPTGLLLQCRKQLSDYLSDTDGVAHADCRHRVSNPGEIVGIFGHMHEFGKSFRMTLNPGTPEERILLDIPNWSFDWQLHYEPLDTVVLDRDDTLLVECTWDRALAPMPEPRYITWNEGTEDEMCYSTVATVAALPD